MRNNDHLDMFSYRALNIMFIKISQFHVFVHKKNYKFSWFLLLKKIAYAIYIPLLTFITMKEAAAK